MDSGLIIISVLSSLIGTVILYYIIKFAVKNGIIAAQYELKNHNINSFSYSVSNSNENSTPLVSKGKPAKAFW